MTERTTLVTGFPTSFLATRVVRKILAEEPNTQIRCVVQPKFRERAEAVVAAMPSDAAERVRLFEGDVTSMDLGLSGKEIVALGKDVHVIHHCAAATYLGVSREVAHRLNVDGVREVLELARDARNLERLVHWSTALVSGGRSGWVREDELTAPAGFRNVVEETRFRGEALVRRAMDRVPVTILRPSIGVGDSRTGEIDRFEGPYLLVLFMLSSPVDLRVPLPGRGDALVNLVPIDYVVDAGYLISNDARAIGKTHHLVDPEPVTAREVFERIAEAAGRPMPRGFLPTTLATALLRAPGLERFVHAPRTFLEQLATEVSYDARNTRLIVGDRVRCPPFSSYVETMVRHVRSELAQRDGAAEAATPDALAELDPLG